MNEAWPQEIDIAIVGAGPQALTLAVRLLQKKNSLSHRFLAIDPAGAWLERWCRQFSAYEIPHLRSPAVHHPDPNPFALRAFAESRSQGLVPPYDLPETRLFEDFCGDVIRRWGVGERVLPAQVERLEPFSRGQQQRLGLTLTGGRFLMAKRVVLAVGGGAPRLPSWAKAQPPVYPPERLLHAGQVDLRRLEQLDERALIVGSGLTGAHLALGAIKRGAKVIMMARRSFYSKLFDADPGWLGPKYLNGFQAEPSWEKRWQMIQSARNGGSLTPAILSQLRRFAKAGKLSFYEHCEVQSAQWQGDAWRVTYVQSGSRQRLAHLSVHRIWLATGTAIDARGWPLLAEIYGRYPAPTVGGLPVLDQHLRWPGCPNLFIMGGAAALQLGPAARNLFGGRLASERIAPALLGKS